MRLRHRWLACAVGVGLSLCLCTACIKRSTPTPMLAATPTPVLPSSFTPTPTAGVAQPSPTPSEAAPVSTDTPEAPASPTPAPGVTVTAPALSATLRVGWLGVPQSLTPDPAGPSAADAFLACIYDTLIYHSLNNTFAPAVAKSWSSPDGGKTWWFDLQPNLKTQAGQPFTSADVAAALQAFQTDAGLRYYSGYSVTVQSVEARAPSSLAVTLTQPVGNVEAVLHWMPLVPKSVVDSGAFAQGQHVGTGPFALQGFEPGQRITLTANPAYWMGSPRIGSVVVQNYADADQLAQALLDGSVDVVAQAPPRLIAMLKADARVQVLSGPQPRVSSLLLNVSTKPQSTGHPALRNRQVRLAIAHCIDRQQLIDLALLGRGIPGTSIIPPALGKWFSPGLQDVPFDLDKAQQLLEGAGYKDSNGDGVRESLGGAKPLNLRLFVPASDAAASQTANMIGNWLSQAGVAVTIQTLTPAALASAAAFDYDLLLADLDSGPDPGYLMSTLTSGEIESGLNRSGYSNPAYDSLWQQQATTVDQEQRRALVWQLQQIALDDRPRIALYYELAVQAFRKDRFRNWLFVPNGALSLLDVRSLLQVEPIPQ